MKLAKNISVLNMKDVFSVNVIFDPKIPFVCFKCIASLVIVEFYAVSAIYVTATRRLWWDQ